MKKIFILFSLLMTFILSAGAQTAVQTTKTFDNVSIGVTVGASTPLDFNSMFPVNPIVGIRLQKDFTPFFGLQAEGLAILNDNHFSDLKTTVKATNVGLNGVTNLSNLLFGYKGKPRVFEVSAVTGLGWLHTWNTNANFLTAKTGFDIAFNLGSKRAHSIVITPAVFWNLNKLNKIQFNKSNSQLALTVSYVYHFKTSNGTHSFKVFDVGAMNDEINTLHKQTETDKQKIDALEDVIIKLSKELNDAKATPTTASVGTKTVQNEWVVTFAKASANLTEDAKATLNTIPEGTTVKVEATASPEGTKKFNQKVSEDRAKAVAEFLKAKGVKVTEAIGKGVTGDTSNRIAIATAQ